MQWYIVITNLYSILCPNPNSRQNSSDGLTFLLIFQWVFRTNPENDNILPDALSRYPELPIDVRSCSDASLPLLILEPSWLAKVYLGQLSYVSLVTFIDKAKSSDCEFVLPLVYGLSLLCRPKTEVYQFFIRDGLGLHRLLLEEAHCTPLASHMGAHKIISGL